MAVANTCPNGSPSASPLKLPHFSRRSRQQRRVIYPNFCGWNPGSSNSVSSQFKGLILADVRFRVAVLLVTLPLEAMPAVVTLSVGWELSGQQHPDSLLPKGGNAMASSSQGRKHQGFSASQGRQCRAQFIFRFGIKSNVQRLSCCCARCDVTCGDFT